MKAALAGVGSVRRNPFFAALGSLVLLGGCSEAYWTSNIRDTMLLGPSGVIATNADVRLVHRFQGQEMVPAFYPNGSPVVYPDRYGNPKQALGPRPREYLCAEPSPDVARAVQAALSLSGGAAGTATPPTGGTAIEAQLAFQTNASRSESVAQLTKRIATIQLLRDGMYRACEAYANGAIGPEIYTAITSRYDRMMITMLLGEMAAGNFGSAAILSGSSNAEASADATAGANARLLLATRNREEAQRQWEEQVKIVTAQNARNEDAQKQLAATPTDPAVQEVARVEKANLDAAAAIRDERKTALETAKTDEADAKKGAAVATGLASARGKTSTSAGGTIVERAPTPGESAEGVGEILARMQRSYLNDPPITTMVMMCFSQLARPAAIGRILGDQCIKLFEDLQKSESRGLLWDISARPQLREIDAASLAKVTSALKDKLTPAQLAAVIKALRVGTDTPTGLPQHVHGWTGMR
jgi:hypothetical protein